MSHGNKELEVKFYLSRRAQLEAKLYASGALLVAPRVRETNLRLDTPDQALLNSGRLLRLRQDTKVRVTYKGTGSIEGGARLRQELELTVSDIEVARQLFDALGFQVSMMYEKYRTSYQLQNVEVALDELPYGDFIEIEGPDGESIRKAAELLGLKWQARILDSYTILFERVRELMGLKFSDLSFENFEGLKVTPSELGVEVAD